MTDDSKRYHSKNPVRWYRVTIWDFEVLVKADSHGSARYEVWLNFHDAYDLDFGDFCKQSKVKSVNKERGKLE